MDIVTYFLSESFVSFRSFRSLVPFAMPLSPQTSWTPQISIWPLSSLVRIIKPALIVRGTDPTIA